MNIKEFIVKNKKQVAIALYILGGVLLLLLIWSLLISKIIIFRSNERKFTNAVKRYYEYHSKYLPKKGEIRELTLQELYDIGQIEGLFAPKSKKMCDTNSWVRVYLNDKNEYKYTTYLKCGIFHSLVDHQGPKIELNGDTEITLALNSEYKELGVSKVKDNKSKIKLEDVKIDASQVDMTKTGTYNVTYTAQDKTGNRTVVVRKVIVNPSLTDIVRNSTSDDGYYKGIAKNNYLLFSGMLWRIVNVNPDGTVKIVASTSVSNIHYSDLEKDYSESNIKSWLNEYFYSNLKNTKDYIVSDAKWCADYSGDKNNIIDQCSNYVESKVGLLTLFDLNRSYDGESSYLNSLDDYWLMTRRDPHFVYTHTYITDGHIDQIRSTDVTGVRPALLLKSNLYITGGNGSFGQPYLIGDYKIGKINDSLKDRYVGEYVDYSGMLFRVSGFDKDKNIKLTSVDYIGNITESKYFSTSYDGKMLFNPKEKGNVAYKLNKDYLDFFDTSLVIEHEYTVYNFDETKKYSEFTENSKFNAKLAIPSSFEMYSAFNNVSMAQLNYWLLDYVSDDTAFIINSSNGRTFNISKETFPSNALKIVTYIKNTAKITKGTGINFDPFYIK